MPRSWSRPQPSPHTALALRLTCLLAPALGAFGCGSDDDPASTTGQARPGLSYASWSASTQDALEPIPFPVPPAELAVLEGQTMRQVMRLSAGGNRLRVRLSNRFGTAPVVFDRAALGLGAGAGSIDTSSQVALSFAGATRISIAPGDEVWSDFVAFPIAAETTVALSLYSAGPSSMQTTHSLGRQTTFITDGDAVDTATIVAQPDAPTSYYWVNAIDVEGTAPRRVVVAFGDSITDGFASTVDGSHRYPNYLSELLTGAAAGDAFSVVNAGISGNRVLTNVVGPSGTSRFAHDAIEPTGAEDVVLLLGINDIGIAGFLPDQEVTPEQITEGLGRMVSQAKGQGLRVHLATLLPFQGTNAPYYSDASEAKRQAVNAWIRANQDVQSVIDFDRLMGDPANPLAMQPALDSGDHLHPNDAGYETMARAVADALGN